MNLVYIHTHDSGRHLGPYGQPLENPNLLELAEESVVFRQCFSMAPTCSPSRAGLLTGMAPHSSGMLGLAHRGFSLTDPRQHLSALLRERGWLTALAGIQHEAARASDLAYDRVLSCDPREMDRFGELDGSAYDYGNAKNVAAFLETAKSPFFLSFGLFNTHRAFPVPKDPDRAKRLMPPAGLVDDEGNRLDVLAYNESARVVDDCVGTVLAALKKSGLEEDTIVLFTTDHGIAFPRNKCTLYDDGIGVACLLKYPGNRLRGEVSDAMISQVDLLPTIFELLGLPLPPQFQGRSLLPLLDGETEEIRDALFAEVTFHAAYEPLRCVRTKRFKYIRRFDESRLLPVPANIDDCHAKDLLLRGAYLSTPLPREEFYDLAADPFERENLIGRPAYAADIRNLRERLGLWMRETRDPLLAGPVPLPKGAFANKVDCVSPSTPDFDFGG